jgi:hypothetical protein
LLALTAASKRLRFLIHGALAANPSYTTEFVVVRNTEWPLLVFPFIKKLMDDGPPPSKANQLADHQPHSRYFQRYVRFAAYYSLVEKVERNLEWEEQVYWMLANISTLTFPGVETLRGVVNARQGVLTRAEISGMTIGDLESRMEIALAKHRYHRGEQRGAYAGVYLDAQEQLKRFPPPAWAFYENFTGVHLYLALKRLPVPSRDITKLVIDGTAVTEEDLYPMLLSLERTLQFVSARRCTKLGAEIWCDWLEGAAKFQRPIALKALKVGSAIARVKAES